MTERADHVSRLLGEMAAHTYTAPEIDLLFRGLMSRLRGQGAARQKVCAKRGHPLEGRNVRIQKGRRRDGTEVEYRGGCRLCPLIDRKLREAGVADE